MAKKARNHQKPFRSSARVSGNTPRPRQDQRPGNYRSVLLRAAVAPQSISPADASLLQRTVGNKIVGRLARRGFLIQPKLDVGPVNDSFEQEADTVAKQVVEGMEAGVTSKQAQGIQRQEEEEVQMKPLRRQEEEEEVQMKADSRQGGKLAGSTAAQIERARGSGSQLSDHLRQPMENAFGVDFTGVRVHTDDKADHLNQSIQAKAFTTGKDIFFRKGQYQPGSRGGQELIAHELTHVVQQSAAAQRAIQRAFWGNVPAKFRTDNEDDTVPNSEYSVNTTTYQRYAPINKRRAPEQVYHEGPRHFAYIRASNVQSSAYDAIWDAPKVTGIGSSQVQFGHRTDPKAPRVTAYLAPTEGDTVYDLDLDAKGNGYHQHVGHPVEQLGQKLPTLDDPAKVANALMMQQEYIKYQAGKQKQ